MPNRKKQPEALGRFPRLYLIFSQKWEMGLCLVDSENSLWGKKLSVEVEEIMIKTHH
jgi:hypothetical protein